MKLIRKNLTRIAGVLPAFALFVGLSSASGCWAWYHQPKVPDQLRKQSE